MDRKSLLAAALCFCLLWSLGVAIALITGNAVKYDKVIIYTTFIVVAFLFLPIGQNVNFPLFFVIRL